MNIYGIGVSALNAAQAGIATTTHNIANASTPGFSRQETVQTAQQPQSMGAGYFGQGVNVTNVVRRYDQFLGAQVLEAQTQASNLNTQLGLSQQVSNLLGDSSGGLTPVMQDFFSAVNAVSNAPQSIPARQTMIGSAQSLVGRFQSLDQNLGQIRDGLNGQISSSVSSINSYAKQIASLNEKIVQLQANTPNQAPNDLLDQRDQLVSQLSQEIRVTTLKQSDGTMNVFVGNGQSLVVGNIPATLQTVTSATDPTALEVAYLNNGSAITIPQSALQGGNLGGYLSFRQDVLDPAVNALGRIAMGLADTFNQQQQQGVDLRGALGNSMFTLAAPQVTIASNNTGTGVLAATVTSTSSLTVKDYLVRFDSATGYTVYDSATSTKVGGPYTAAAMAAGQEVIDVATGVTTGIKLQITSGAAATGDSFLVRPTANGASGLVLSITDPTKIAAASPIRSNASIANIGSGAIAQPQANPINTPKVGNTGVMTSPVATGYPLNSKMQESITLTFLSATTYTATGVGAPSGVQTLPASQTISINGWSAQVTTPPVAGDTFSITSGIDPNLQKPIRLTFTSATAYTVTDTTLGTTLATGVAYMPGSPININGWSTQITGTPAAGDIFTVSSNTNATTDGSNILKMAALQTAYTMVNGTTSYQGAYGQLIGQVGTQTRELTVTSKAQTSLLDQVTKSQQAVSGVNLDEEAANLLRYQQAYQAAAKAIQIANTMFDTILNLK